MIDLSFLPWKTLIPMLIDDTPIEDIQSAIKPLYYDTYIIKENVIHYTGLSSKSKQDYDTELLELTPDKTIPYALQYRIYELWKRFTLLRANRDIVDSQEVFDAFLLVCSVMYERLLFRRIDHVSYKRDESMISVQ